MKHLELIPKTLAHPLHSGGLMEALANEGSFVQQPNPPSQMGEGVLPPRPASPFSFL